MPIGRPSIFQAISTRNEGEPPGRFWSATLATIISAKMSGIKRSPRTGGPSTGLLRFLMGEPVMGRENPPLAAVNHQSDQFNPRPLASPWGAFSLPVSVMLADKLEVPGNGLVTTSVVTGSMKSAEIYQIEKAVPPIVAVTQNCPGRSTSRPIRSAWGRPLCWAAFRG